MNRGYIAQIYKNEVLIQQSFHKLKKDAEKFAEESLTEPNMFYTVSAGVWTDVEIPEHNEEELNEEE